jgi:very-short-patch-repair endonuclease
VSKSKQNAKFDYIMQLVNLVPWDTPTPGFGDPYAPKRTQRRPKPPNTSKKRAYRPRKRAYRPQSRLKTPDNAAILRTLGKSWYEVQLVFELRLFCKVEYDCSVQTDAGKLRPDMFLPAFNLFVEYDGSYWHREKYQRDLWKRKQLIKAGYNVCRIRENLKLTDSGWDLFIDLGMTPRDCAITLVTHIQKLFPGIKGIDIKALSEYQNDILMNNRAAALEYLKEKDKEAYDKLIAKQKERELKYEQDYAARKKEEQLRKEEIKRKNGAQAIVNRFRVMRPPAKR